MFKFPNLFKKIPPFSRFMFSTSKTFLDLKFTNLIYSSFEIEPNTNNTQPHQVPDYFYSRIDPTPIKSPQILSLSRSALSLLDLPSPEILISSHHSLTPSLEDLLSGNKLHPDSNPIAHNYSGYQFGSFAGQLGDGRAITIGDLRNEKGEIWELQLKGSGMTPYSRFADGRAVLRSSIREYLCSEAMHFLGIPTTRALSLVKGEDTVMRDMLYDGHPKEEKCAIVLRLSPTFIRFGSFEFGLERRTEGSLNEKELERMAKLFDFIVKNHYPEIKTEGRPKTDVVFEFYQEIVKRTAKLVAMWQCVGFCHGVLNTDNMSILGVTIDYGPYGFLDYFDVDHVCNHSDHSGRYSYENQPFIGKWNLARLADALKILSPHEKMLEFLKTNYDKFYGDAYNAIMREKLGFFELKKEEDIKTIASLNELLNMSKLDFTNFFRKLSDFDEFNDTPDYIKAFAASLCELSPPDDIFLDFFKTPITEQQLTEVKRIAEIQPQVVQMLGYTQEVIELYEKKLNVVKYFKSKNSEERKTFFVEKWGLWLSAYKLRLLEETKNCENSAKAKNRKVFMNKINPAFILRNYILENCIRKAEHGDYSEIEALLELVQNPYDHSEKKVEYCVKAPGDARKICVSCSS